MAFVGTFIDQQLSYVQSNVFGFATGQSLRIPTPDGRLYWGGDSAELLDIFFEWVSAGRLRYRANSDANSTIELAPFATAVTNKRSLLRLYQTIDATTNYERLAIQASANAADYRIFTEAAGTGSHRSIAFFIGATESFRIMETTGDFRIESSRQLQISSDVVLSRSAANRLSLASGDLFQIGGTGVAGTTAGTNLIVLHEGTAPAGTLTDAGALYVRDAAGVTELSYIDSGGTVSNIT